MPGVVVTRLERCRARLDPTSLLVRPGVVRCGPPLIHSCLLSSGIGCCRMVR